MQLLSAPRVATIQHYAILLALVILPVPASFSQGPAPNQIALTSTQQQRAEVKTRKAYSTFDAAGINSISCEGAVDWETLFKRQTTASFREQVLPVLQGTRFVVTLGRDGKVSVSTRSTVVPASQQAAERANTSIQSFGGVIATVLQGWARFALSADLPAANDSYQLDKAGDHFLVAFKNGPADVAVTMDRSFVMGEERIDAADGSTSDGSMLTHPTFTSTSNGYLVTSWSVAFPHGRGSALSVDARYMQVEGVEVPAQMVLRSSLPSFGEITLPLVLTNYQFQK